ncbi:MAG: hypothetical protein Q4E05_00915 [Pseudoclavibacter sp.]|nr:hypothetical protein [Pseudoclavibacter sp.]
MERIERLRRLARDEREAILHARVRAGEDPAEVVAEVPEADEFVVRMLHDDALEARGLAAEYALAKLAQYEGRPDAEHFRRSTEAIDAEILGEIAAARPELGPTVRSMLKRRGAR